MGVVRNVARHVIRDKFEAEVKTAQAKLETLKAEAETAKADIEIKAITELLAKQHEILHKLREHAK
jgi:3-hydroxyacyl-CoA dehydrogenase